MVPMPRCSTATRVEVDLVVAGLSGVGDEVLAESDDAAFPLELQPVRASPAVVTMAAAAMASRP